MKMLDTLKRSIARQNNRAFAQIGDEGGPVRQRKTPGWQPGVF
jgi:hypothetical protein